MWLFLIQLWRKYTWQPKLIAFVVIVVLFLFVYQSCKHKVIESNLQNEIQIQKEATATKDAIAVNKAENVVKESETITNSVINKDSNKFDKNSNVLTDRYCRKMCQYQVEDSSCFEWKKQNKCN